MSKTWQEEFNREFTTLGMGNEICSHQDVDDIKQFITDLRKQDMEELTKMLTGAWSVELKSDDVIKLVKDYYAK